MAENTQGGNPICCSFCGKETGKVPRKGYAIYACKALASDGKTYDIKIYLTQQSGEWRLDSPTY